MKYEEPEGWNKPHIDSHNPTGESFPASAQQTAGVAAASLATCQEAVDQLSAPSCSGT